MAAGLKINLKNLKIFIKFLENSLSKYEDSIFKKINKFDSTISVNDLSIDFVMEINKLHILKGCIYIRAEIIL